MYELFLGDLWFYDVSNIIFFFINIGEDLFDFVIMIIDGYFDISV